MGVVDIHPTPIIFEAEFVLCRSSGEGQATKKRSTIAGLRYKVRDLIWLGSLRSTKD
jgi:hypothetical protein